MKRIISIIFMLLGTFIIFVGFFIQFQAKSNSHEENNKLVLERLNIFDQKEVCSTEQMHGTYINTNDYRTVSFLYPNCVHEYNLSLWSKSLTSEDDDVSLEIQVENMAIGDYISRRETEIKNAANDENYVEYKYTPMQSGENEEGFKFKYLEANYKKNNNLFFDEWVIGVAIGDDKTLVFEVMVQNGVFAYESVEKILNSVTISKEKATLLNTKNQEGYLQGSLYQNISLSHEHGYRINLKIPDKYVEMESLTTDFDESTFKSTDADLDLSINVFIERDSTKKIAEKIDQMHRNVISSYDDENYQNIQDTKILKEKLKDKDVYYFIYTYDYNYSDGSIATDSQAYVYYEISEGFYYSLYLNSDKLITFNIIEDFLNFEIEEY